VGSPQWSTADWRRTPRCWAGQILAADKAGVPVEMPLRATFYRIFEKLSHGIHVTGSARTRRSLADQPEGPFRYEQVAAPAS
jgi:hypothetical protein